MNRERKEKEDESSNVKINDEFEVELVDDLFKNLFVEPQVQDAETIEIETQKEDDEFFDLEKNITKLSMLQLSKKGKLPSSI